DRVETSTDACRLDPGGDRRVDEPGAVEMDGEFVLQAGAHDRLDLVERPGSPAGAVVGVLDRDDARRRDVHARPVPDLRDDLLGREAPMSPLEPDGQEPGVRGRPAEL